MSKDEKAVLLSLLALANRSVPDADLDSWRVIGRCECGCASFDLASEQSNVESSSHILADAVGTTTSGTNVGAILWSRAETPSGVEIYTFGPDTNELPTPESIRPFEITPPAD